MVASHDESLIHCQLLLLHLLRCNHFFLNILHHVNIVLWHVSHLWLHTSHSWLSHWIHHISASLSSASSFVLTVWLFATLIGSSLLSTHRLSTLTTLNSSLLLHEHWHALDKKLKVVLELFLVGQVSPLSALGVSLAELLEATLVFSSLVLKLTIFFDLIVIDSQSSSIPLRVVELFFGGRGLIWLLEADKGVKFLLLISWMESQTLNLTMLFKDLFKLFFGDVVSESFDIQVASLL